MENSLDLSEFFNNDESDGHRLAEFLQKRRGGVQRPNFLYLNYETQRKSLHLQLEKLPDKIEEKCSSEDEINNQNGNHKPTVEEELALIHGESHLRLKSLRAPPIVGPSNEALSPVLSVKSTSTVKPLSPLRPLCASIPLSPSKPISPLKPLSAIRKSGGIVSPGDRLRRLSLKRLITKNHSGRRTLLQEFESTVNDANFDPPVCSTPLSEPILCPSSSTTNCNSGYSENLGPNSSDKLPSSSDQCCSHNETLIKTLQRQDEELKNYMGIFETTLKNIEKREKNKTNDVASVSKKQSSFQTTNSPLKRTYILEKGQSPGQVILTPDRSVAGGQSPPSRMLRYRNKKNPPDIQQPSNKVIKSPGLKSSQVTSKISIRVKSPCNKRLSQSLKKTEESPNRTLRRSAAMVDKSRSTTPLHCSLQNDAIQDTPPRNVSVVFPSQEIIPETQDVELAVDNNCIMIQSNDTTHMPVVIIPVNQNCNQINTEYPTNNNTLIMASPKYAGKKKSPLVTNKEECQDKPEDNIKLTDVLTDDDDYTPKASSRCVENCYLNNNSQAPLNLAPSATNLRTKRLRKRSLSRRRLQMDRSQLLNTETETVPPEAHSNNSEQRKRTVKRKNMPLNRAPGTPLNGERFALELKRMSNYEIIDLRKRNSMGRVFATSGCKSSRFQEEVDKKQLQLDDEIEMELLRRNLEEPITNGILQQKESTTNVKKNTEDYNREEFIPVPQEFRDNSHHPVESSLLDEKSIDRISFKTNRSSLRRSNKRKVKAVPKELKQYLEVSKILKTKLKTRKSKLDQTKRSLYTQGNSDIDESNVNSSLEKVEIDQSTNRRKKKQSSDNKSISVQMATSVEQILPYVPSPPPSETDKMPALRVVSPPPPLTISLRESQTQKVQTEHEQLPPPPPEFDTDTGMNSKPSSRQHSPMPQKQPETLSNIEKDENIFKKPLTPPPLKIKKSGKAKKNKTENILLNDMHTAQDTSTDSSLRRSKRQVSVQHPISIFQILYQESFNRRLHNMEKNKARQKQRLKEMSKATLGDNSTINSNKSTDTQKSPTKTSTKTRRKKLPTIPEDQPLMASLHNDMDILKKKTQTKTDQSLMAALHNDMDILKKKTQTKTLKKSKVIRKKNKNDQRTDEQLECSRINLTTPPPVDHFNNVFDHLRNTSTGIEHEYAVASQPLLQVQQQQQQQVNKDIFNGKKLRVRIKRFKSSNSVEESKGTTNSSSTNTNKQLTKLNSTSTTNAVSSSSSASSVGSNQSNFELISWLKNITESENTERNDEIFKEMRISSASNLSFSTIQGVEYAFYDTDEKASLGYLRFKPGQVKPKKKAKRFHLHFVALVGQFRITANDKESRVGPGDMVAIEKSVYYDIENMTDDIGILMVVKK